MQLDHVFIKNMELSARIGTTESERVFPQILRISVKIYLPLRRAGQTDSLNETVDYAQIIENIRNQTQQRTYVLAETIAEEIAGVALTPAVALAVEVEVCKKVFEGIEAVGVFIRREKNLS